MTRRRRRAIARLAHAAGRAATSNTAIDTAAVLLSGAIGLVGGPAAGALATVATTSLADVAKQYLTKRESARLEKVAQLAAAAIFERTASGVEARADLDPETAASLLEGVLLAARRSYEEKKVPLLANLLAAAPFTSTPLANLIAPLAIIERLTYRQLCILAMIPGSDPHTLPPLTEYTIAEIQAANPVGELVPGVMAELLDLVGQRLLVKTLNGVIQTDIPDGRIRPAQLRLTYPALLIANGARLRETIPDTDLAELRTILG